ncbi:MAG: hypothetical protein ACI36X_01745 [Bacteroidaceae bacterium]
MLAVFQGLLVAVSTIPSQYIKEQVLSSVETWEKEGLKYRIGQIPLFRLDNFTDALMMNIALGVDSDCPLESSLRCTYTLQDDRMSILEGIRDLYYSHTETDKRIDYTRYWNGYLVFLRPVLLLADCQHIRIINAILLLLLAGIVVWQSFLKGMPDTGWAFMGSAMLFNLWIVPLTVQYSNTFYVALLACLYVLLHKSIYRLQEWGFFFFVVGSVTCYVDLLTTPLLTLCVPLTFLVQRTFIVNERRIELVKQRYQLVLGCTSLWIVGYAVVWIGKWILAAWLVDYKISDAIAQIVFRTSTSFEGYDFSIIGMLYHLTAYPSLMVFISSIVILFLYWNIRTYRRNASLWLNYSPLLLLSLFPVGWVLVLRNHSVIHFWFVWRVFFASAFAYALFLMNVRKKCD